jgi:hypothetical protein
MYDQSRNARSESGYMIIVVTRNWSRDERPESGCVTGVMMCDQSRDVRLDP